MAEPNFQGLRPTGRQIKDPAATLYELEGEDGRVYTSIAYDERYQGMEALTLNVRLVESFLAYPMVAGLVELAKHDLETATFSYPTGRVFTLTEVLRVYRDLGKAPGPRAALEMMLLAAEILDEAGQTGPIQGCFSHGDLNPWRIAIRLDGELQVFGYGLAHVDLIANRLDPSAYPIAPESLRYAPPERIEGQPEGPSADVYSLTACAFEMATGRALYDALDPDALRRSIGLSEATTLLSGRSHGLPNAVAKTFARALIYDPDTRLAGAELLDELRTLLARPDVEGDGLATIMEKMRGRQLATAPKGRKLVATTSTELFTAEQLRQQLDDEDDDPPAEESRWGRVTRRRADDAAEPSPTPAPAAEPTDDPPRRRLRRRSEVQAPEPEPEPEPVAEEPIRRLRRFASPTEAAPEPETDAGAIRRRLRGLRSADGDARADEDPSADGSAPDEPTPPPDPGGAPDGAPVRRLRRGT